MMVKHMSSREARANFADLLGSVYYTNEAVIVEKKGKPVAVMISPAAYQAFQEATARDWAVIEELQAANADRDPDEVLADVTAAVEEVREEGRQMRTRRSDHKPALTLADGYQSIPALQPPRTQEEIAAIVADERAERERERIEQDAKAGHAARTLAKLRDADC